MWKRIKEPFDFTKREQNGLLVFCLLMLLVLLLPRVVLWTQPAEPVDQRLFEQEAAAFRASLVDIEKATDRKWPRTEERAGLKDPEYFYFDPNTLQQEGWQQLGLSQKQAAVIRNYISKGGRFRKKEDLQRIYSLSAVDYQRLAPYIRIVEVADSIQSGPRYNARYQQAAPQSVEPELNSADSAALEGLRGIGPVLARRITKYRERLGGFYQKEQLKEVYGIDSALYVLVARQVNLDDSSLRKLHVNTATFDDLKRHPYLSYKQMNAILQYRKQHGPYRSAADLAKIAILNEEILRKIAPYLSFDD